MMNKEIKELNCGYRTKMIITDEFNRVVTELSKTANECAISAEELAKALNFQKKRKERVLIGYSCKCGFCGKKHLVEPKDIRTCNGIEIIRCQHCGYDTMLDSKGTKEIWKK